MVRVGLLGAGVDALARARVYAHMPAVELVAVADVDRAAADQLAAATGARPYYGITPLLDDPAVEMVDVRLPVRVREQAVTAAAAAGKHVLCETPLAVNLAAADRMLRAVQAAGVLAMAATLARFDPYYHALRAALAAEPPNAPLALHITRFAAGPAAAPLRDLHSHDLDTLSWLLGRPAQVYSRAAIDPTSGAPDHLLTVLDYGTRQAWAVASFLASAGYPFTMQARLMGSRGVLEYQAAADGERALWTYLPGAAPQPVDAPAVDPLAHLLTYFVGCIERSAPPTAATLAEARAALYLALAAQQSAENGEVVGV